MKQHNDTAIDLFHGRTEACRLRTMNGIGGFSGFRLQELFVIRVLYGAIRNFAKMLGLLIAFGVFALQAQADTQNSISSLSVSKGIGTTTIKVELAQPLASLPPGFTINEPPRIAFDFSNTANGSGKSVQDFNEGDLRALWST